MFDVGLDGGSCEGEVVADSGEVVADDGEVVADDRDWEYVGSIDGDACVVVPGV